MNSLIPNPLMCEMKNGVFLFDKDMAVSSQFQLPLLNCARSEDGKMRIVRDESLEKEEYCLSVGAKGIDIKAASETGAYYALQTLRLAGEFDLGKNEVPYMEIHDKPRFKWRGLNLDESRHFFGAEQVKALLDIMFLSKLNVLHWHLTDDQGWRIEIQKYPLLTKIGSKRAYTQVDGWGSDHILHQEHSGYYTQEQIREIVDYAAQRGIMIVPEIDMPAHFAAAMAAYPWLACREIETEVPGYFGDLIPRKKWGIPDWNRTACVGKESTFEFIFQVLDEACALFPAPYFHIGGDEMPKNEWKKCEKCRQIMKEHRLKNEEELQAWFVNRIARYVHEKGKRLIGWNEICKGKNLDSSVIVQYWTPQRDRLAEAYVNSGGNVILSNHQAFYFDLPYAQIPLRATYEYTYKNFGIKPESEKNILGLEGEAWTEWIDCREKLEACLFPRLQALSEAAWSVEDRKDWHEFKQRLDHFKLIYDKLGLEYTVDRVSCPQSVFDRIYVSLKFHKGDTHLEMKRSQAYKAKGEK